MRRAKVVLWVTGCVWLVVGVGLSFSPSGCGGRRATAIDDASASLDMASAIGDASYDGGSDGPRYLDRYVAPAGVDKGDCDIANPCATFAYPASLSAPGDTVVVLTGNYGPQTLTAVNGTFGLPITIRAMGKVNLARTLPLDDKSVSAPLIAVTDCSYLTVSGFNLTGAPAQMGYVATTAPMGEVYVTKTDFKASDPDIVIDALTIDTTAGGCITTSGADSVQVSNSTLSNCGVTGPVDGGGAGATGNCISIDSDDSLVRANQMSGCADGVHVSGLRARIFDNTISYAAQSGVYAYPQAQIQSNTIHHCSAYGVHADVSSIIQQNVIALCGSGGDSAGIAVVLPSNDIIENNTLYENGGHELFAIVEGDPASAPLTIENNIFFHAVAGDALLGVTPAANSVIDYNLYYNVTTQASMPPDGGNGDFGGAHSVVQKDPQFVNPTAMPLPDLHLMNGSPAHATGTNVGLPFSGGAPNMGAL